MEGRGSSAAQLQPCQAGSFLPRDPPRCGGAQPIPTAPQCSTSPSASGSGRFSIWTQGHTGEVTATAGEAEDFVESQQSRRKKEQEVDREEENRWE